ncbi:MAG: zinc ribbon domain-containing protein [Bacillota bacterium]|jgi:hypothetical protein
MANRFGGFGGLIKGLTGFMPQDDPNVQLITAQSDLEESRKRELELYAQIGKEALRQGAGQWLDLEDKLRLVQQDIALAEDRLRSAQREQEAKERAKQAQDAKRTCQECGHVNPDGARFCQECGQKLGPARCHQCGVELLPGTRFCGECGAKQVQEG